MIKFFISVALSLAFCFLEAYSQENTTQTRPSDECKSLPTAAAPLLQLRALTSSDIHASTCRWYRVDLAPDHFTRVNVKQISADVMISAFDSTGRLVTRSQLTRASSETISISLLADASSPYASAPGSYLIEIEPASREEDGKYEVSLAEDAQPQPVDAIRIEAERNFMDGNSKREGKSKEKREAIAAYVKSLQAYERLAASSDRNLMIEGLRGEALSKVFLVYCYGSLSEYHQALLYAQGLAQVWHSFGDLQPDHRELVTNLEAQAYSNLGYLEGELGRLEEAIEDDQKALGLWTDKVEKAATFINMGRALFAAGQLDRALNTFRASLDELKDIPQTDSLRQLYEILALSNLGRVEFQLKNYDAAAQSFSKASALPNLPPSQQAVLLNNSASLLIQAGKVDDLNKAHDMIGQAAALWKSSEYEVGDAIAENSLGGLSRAKHNISESTIHYSAALQILNDLEKKYGDAPNLVLKQVVLFNLARAEFEADSYVKSQHHLEDALLLFEQTSTAFSDDEYRQIYFSSQPQLYELYITVLMKLARLHPRQGHEAIALQASEQARSRKLLSTLSKAQIKIVPNISQSVSDRVRDTQEQLKRSLARWKKSLRNSVSKEEQNAAKANLQASRAAYDASLRQLAEEDSRYANLFQPKAISVSQMQKLVTDNKTIVLEYSLTDWGTYVWVLTASSLISVDLHTSYKTVDDAVQRLRDDLTERNCAVALESPDEYVMRTDSSDKRFAFDARRLSEILLKPIAHYLQQPNVILVLDGSLQEVPFAALIDPAATGQLRFFGERHFITYVPSLSTIKIGRETAQATIANNDSVAIFADLRTPQVTNNSDSTIFRGIPSFLVSGADQTAIERTNRGRTCEPIENRFLFLPGARAEAKAIKELADQAGRTATVVPATISSILTPEFEDYEILHFATHAFAPSLQPGESGIVLEDVTGGVSTLRYFGLSDIYNMRLRSSLVTLSACETGIGKDIRGEGVVSLGRAFMYAGSPRVVASLWKVDDQATAALMKSFYEEIFIHQLSPPAALRFAQKTIREQTRWRSPYYWAGFIVQGEWLGLGL